MSAKNIVSSDLSKRYAAAIFELADEKRLVDKVAKDLQSIDNAIGASNDLPHLINSPVIKRKDQNW